MVVLTLQLLNYAKCGITNTDYFLKLAFPTKRKMSQTQTTNRAKIVHVLMCVCFLRQNYFSESSLATELGK